MPAHDYRRKSAWRLQAAIFFAAGIYAALQISYGAGTGVAAATTHAISKSPQAKDLKGLDQIGGVIRDKRVIYVGERHDRYDHHLNQLEVIKQVYAETPDMAIGVEFIQKPFQKYLDAYINGTIDEKEMISRTEYFDRWGHDYRLYRPIIRYAHEHRIPMVALSLAAELTQKISASGLAGLSDDDRREIPADIDHGDKRYREMLRGSFNIHSRNSIPDFDRFVETQLIWDEVMADRIADYLRKNPQRRMVVLAGAGHLVYGSGIPRRVARRMEDVNSAIILTDDVDDEMSADMADVLLVPYEIDLGMPARLGVSLDTRNGAMRIEGFAEESAAKEAGVRIGDRIAAMNGKMINKFSDIQLELLDAKSGDKAALKVLRQDGLGKDTAYEFDVRLK